MKKMCLFFLLSAAVAGSSGCRVGRAVAKFVPQTTFPALGVISGRHPSLGPSGAELQDPEIVVFNETEDDKPVRVFEGGRLVSPQALQRGGDPWRKYASAGIFGSRRKLVFSAQVCSGGAEEVLFFIPPPTWATDEHLLGTAALAPDVLESAGRMPSEPALKRRVEAIKQALDDQKALGRKKMKKEIAEWFSAVRKRGLYFRDTACHGPVTEGYPLDLSYYYGYGPYYGGREQIVLYVRGSIERGYYIEAR